MKTFALWTSYLALRLPCPLLTSTFSTEHVLPKSRFPRVVVEDPQNLIPLPKALNNARGNRPYTSKHGDGYLVYACKSCPFPGWCAGAAVVSEEGVLPPDPFKGPIARSVLEAIAKYPHLSERISNDVLDYDTAIEWDRRFPMSVQEHSYRSNSKSS